MTDSVCVCFQHTVAMPWAWKMDGLQTMTSQHLANGTRPRDLSTPGEFDLKTYNLFSLSLVKSLSILLFNI